MTKTVRLTVQTGPHKGSRFCFRGPISCLVGRAPDCFVRFAGAERDQSVSRHHCQLLIDPPAVRVQDLGSRNGTYVNGRPLQAESPGQDMPVGSVAGGDMITIGGTSFVVDMVDCPDLGDGDQDPGWQEGQQALADCPIRCSADGSMPLVGCCVGGFAAPQNR